MAGPLGGLDDVAEAVIAARLLADRLDADQVARIVSGPSAAYAVQRLVRARARATPLGPAAGYKIGMSTEVAQRNYNLVEPISGHIFQSRLLRSGARLSADRRQRIAVECEIAVRLGTGLPPTSAPFELRHVGAAVESYHIGIEVLEDRFTRSDGASIWALAADDMLGFGGVIGAPLESFDPFRNDRGVVTIDGVVRATGLTSDLQGGGPLFGLAWLANRVAAEDTSLCAGDVIFCGGITAPAWIVPDGRAQSYVVASIEGIGRAELVIEWS